MRREIIGDAVLYCGDCLDVAAELEAASIDAIVSDPPYGLEFMGKDWDRGVPGVHFWEAFFRVVKPGAHLLAFGGTRTFHRQVVAIEDAGWEIRDQLGWLYGSGFPKNMDVSKAIDRRHVMGEDGQFEWKSSSPIDGDVYTVTAFIKAARDRAGKTNGDIDRHFGFNGMAGHWTSQASQPAVPTWPQWEILKALLGMSDELDDLVVAINGGKGGTSIEGTALAEREVVGYKVGTDTTKQSIAVAVSAQGLEESTKKVFAITTAHTEAAKQWEGWGTALKPAWEPICLARKPLVGTVAGNVMRYSVGAINIGGCRVEVFEEATPDVQGRWPANILHDGSDEVVALFPAEDGASAARFFYAAKASREDRDDGLAGELREAGVKNASGRGFSERDPHAKVLRRNIHPTVKPTDLMRWCIRLITPPRGVVFDPFMGSGSTGKAAMLEGKRFVGAELSPEYFDIACRRIEAAYKAAQRQPTLFDELQVTNGKAADILQKSLF